MRSVLCVPEFGHLNDLDTSLLFPIPWTLSRPFFLNFNFQKFHLSWKTIFQKFLLLDLIFVLFCLIFLQNNQCNDKNVLNPMINLNTVNYRGEPSGCSQGAPSLFLTTFFSIHINTIFHKYNTFNLSTKQSLPFPNFCICSGLCVFL